MKKLIFTALLSLAAAGASAQVAGPMKDTNGVIDNTLDSLVLAQTARPIAGSSRVGSNPVLFLVGNSTMRTGTRGNGDNGQWGWGYYAPDFFDPAKITVENHALGGMSSRTFYNRLWDDVVKGVKPGDWVLIELGHNDNGPYDSGRARATIPGVGTEVLDVTIQETGEKERVYTYGEYMRKYIRDVRAAGGRPILCTLTPRNMWVDADSTIIVRGDSTFSLWIKQVGEEMQVPVVDLNKITADKFERFGKEKVKYHFYIDRIHTSAFGAKLNAESAVEGIRSNPELAELAEMLLPEAVDTVTGSSRKGKRPVVFLIGDSTVKNKDDDTDDMWGWGSVFAEELDPQKYSVENHAKAGRSARTFLDEGRWDKVYAALQPGDYVIMQFGHNDGGPVNTDKARGELPGSSDQSKVFRMEATGKNQVVYTYGWYLRKYVLDALEKGAIPVILSPTPRNIFDGGKIDSFANTYCQWARDIAERTGAIFIDINAITGEQLQHIADTEGLQSVNANFKRDHTHTSLQGARRNAHNVATALFPKK